MSQSGNSEHKPLQSISASMPVIALGGQIGCVTLVIVLVAAFGGIWLDNLLGTKPFLTIILILGAAPLSLFLTYLMAVRAINKVNQPAVQDAKNESLKEDETSE
jgi:F0F1-type ATP synthase assembly protein I